MADIRSYIRNHMIDPLRDYPTAIQDAIIESIIEKLERLYEYTLRFPEIVTPTRTRFDILKTIADQFMFTIRDEGDIQEQIDILDNILYVYNKRGSIDTIENMWKYYGGDLPRDVQVIIPSYNLFRYSLSPLSGAHVFQDSNNRTGLYEIKLTNNTYPIPKLKEFLIKELVAAGNYIYFTNAISADIREDTSPSYMKYDVDIDYFLNMQMRVAPSYHGLSLSGTNPFSGYASSRDHARAADIAALGVNATWSGKENIFIDIVNNIIGYTDMSYYDVVGSYMFLTFSLLPKLKYDIDYVKNLYYTMKVYCTPEKSVFSTEHHLYNIDNEMIKERKYFILNKDLLGQPLGYVVVGGD